MIKEKRRFPRLKLKIPLGYQILGTPEEVYTLSEDISLGGVGFINNSFIAPKALLSLELQILSKILRPVGRVSWAQEIPHSDRYRVGVEFSEFYEGEKKFLDDYITLKTENP